MNNVAITGATSSSYTTPATTTSQSGEQFTVVISNSAGSATTQAATLTVNAPTSTLNSSSTSLSFGTVTVLNSTTQNVTLTNKGTATVTISNVTVTGAGFNASGGSGVILSAGQSATVTATFDPSAAGTASGSLTVTSNATNSPNVISLSGTGQAPVSYSASLNWGAGSSGVTGYNVYSSIASGGPYGKLTGSPVSSTNFKDGNVQHGQTYYYVVTSVNAQNMESAYSAQVSAVIP
jgi:hypothetical protein